MGKKMLVSTLKKAGAAALSHIGQALGKRRGAYYLGRRAAGGEDAGAREALDAEVEKRFFKKMLGAALSHIGQSLGKRRGADSLGAALSHIGQSLGKRWGADSL